MLTRKFTVGNNSPDNAAMAKDLRDEELEDATMDFLEAAVHTTLLQFTGLRVTGIRATPSEDVHGFDVEVTYEEGY